MTPFALMPSWMFSGFVRFGLLDAFGRSIFTACVSSGAVMMKITSSTSITSISGIMLISAIGAASLPALKVPKAMSGAFHRERRRLERRHRRGVVDVRAGRQERKEIVRERIELREHQPVAAHERVISEHRWDRDRE